MPRRRLLPFTALLVLPAFALAEDKPAAAAGDPAESHAAGLLERIEQFALAASGKEEKRVEKWEEGFKNGHPDAFKQWDTNGDGKISADEAKAAVTKLTAMLKEKFPDAFKVADSNGDGTISEEEAKAAHEKLAKEQQHEKKEEKKQERK
jgi:hypothetical protein